MKGGQVLLLGLGVGATVLIAQQYGDAIKNALKRLNVKIVSLKLVSKDTYNGEVVVTGIGSSFWDTLLNVGSKILNKTSTYMLLTVELKNPTPVELSAPDFAFNGTVSHSGNDIAAINVKKAIQIPAMGSATIRIPLKISNKGFFSDINSLLNGKSSNMLSARLTGVLRAMATDTNVDQQFNLID